MPDVVGVMERRHEKIPALPREQFERELRLPSHTVEEAIPEGRDRFRRLQPDVIGRASVRPAKRVHAVRGGDLIRQFRRKRRQALGSDEDMGEPVHHLHAVDRRFQKCVRGVDDGDAAAGIACRDPERQRMPLRTVHEARAIDVGVELVRPLVLAMPTRLQTGAECRPDRSRFEPGRIVDPAPASLAQHPVKSRQPALGRPSLDEVEAKRVEPDDDDRPAAHDPHPRHSAHDAGFGRTIRKCGINGSWLAAPSYAAKGLTVRRAHAVLGGVTAPSTAAARRAWRCAAPRATACSRG